MDPAHTPQHDSGLSLRITTHLIYGLLALAVITSGIFWLAGIASVVLAYMKRGDAAGTMYAPHFDWVLSTFWWAVLWLLLSAIATVIFIGWITGLVAVVWLVYRLIRGWLALAAGKMPLNTF